VEQRTANATPIPRPAVETGRNVDGGFCAAGYRFTIDGSLKYDRVTEWRSNPQSRSARASYRTHILLLLADLPGGLRRTRQPIRMVSAVTGRTTSTRAAAEESAPLVSRLDGEACVHGCNAVRCSSCLRRPSGVTPRGLYTPSVVVTSKTKRAAPASATSWILSLPR